jgi:hypothetical protein
MFVHAYRVIWLGGNGPSSKAPHVSLAAYPIVIAIKV